MPLCDSHLFVEGVNHLLDHCKVSSVPHYCVFKDCMDGHLLKLKSKYSNVLRNWIFAFHELLALIIKIKTKKFEVFYFTCNESKIYESFTFGNKLQKCTFSPYSYFLRFTCESNLFYFNLMNVSFINYWFNLLCNCTFYFLKSIFFESVTYLLIKITLDWIELFVELQWIGASIKVYDSAYTSCSYV